MTRFAFYAGLTAIVLGAVAPAAIAQTPSEAQVIRRQSIERTQQAGAAGVDGRQLIAELRACGEMSPQSVRERCEMQARKTGGQGVTLTLAPNDEYQVQEQDQFERSHN